MKGFTSILILIILLSAAFPAFSQSNERMRELADEGKELLKLYDFLGAVKKWEQGVEIAESNNNIKAAIYFLRSLGNVYHENLDDYQKAITYYGQTLKINREIGNKKGIASSLGDLGSTYKSLGDYKKGKDYHEQALKINREIGNKTGIARSYGNLGSSYGTLDDYLSAIASYHQALTTYRELGNKKYVA